MMLVWISLAVLAVAGVFLAFWLRRRRREAEETALGEEARPYPLLIEEQEGSPLFRRMRLAEEMDRAVRGGGSGGGGVTLTADPKLQVNPPRPPGM